uniref:Uncharacterized protein n=1 Tax=Timema cristinae TaxID=61476 RepID=A0A7R9CCI6_TIMCR|nr:unnamed protein product [Timema cristinae]
MPRPTSKDVTNEMEVTPMVPMRRRIAISQESLGRYSENTLHSGYRIGRTDILTIELYVKWVPSFTFIPMPFILSYLSDQDQELEDGLFRYEVILVVMAGLGVNYCVGACALSCHLPQKVPIVHLLSLQLGSQCRSCITRIPYATLIATIMCIVGVGVFCGTMYRGAMLAVLMFDQVFHLRLIWIEQGSFYLGSQCRSCITRIPYATLIATIMCIVGVGVFCGTMYRGAMLAVLMVETVQMVFVVIGASMGALGLMILFVGCLATGATRTKVYRAWGARVGGRISCAVVSHLVVFYTPLTVPTLLGSSCCVSWSLSHSSSPSSGRCAPIHKFRPTGSFMFPNNTRPEDMEVCDTHELKLFCKDYVERAEIMFILATVACLLVILSLVHYLMCLSANYAHIRDHEKFQELQDLQCLQEPELSMGGSKDRF